jgi:hypothetical protein
MTERSRRRPDAIPMGRVPWLDGGEERRLARGGDIDEPAEFGTPAKRTLVHRLVLSTNPNSGVYMPDAYALLMLWDTGEVTWEPYTMPDRMPKPWAAEVCTRCGSADHLEAAHDAKHNEQENQRVLPPGTEEPPSG